MRRPASWRTTRNRYLWLSRDLARKAAESRQRQRAELADTVCPDGAACPEPQCQAARAACLRGADWREMFAILYPKEGRP